MRSRYENLLGFVDPMEPPRPLVGWRLASSDLRRVLIWVGAILGTYAGLGLYSALSR